MKPHSRCRCLQPPGGLAQTDGLDFTLDTPCTTRLDLVRLMPDQYFRYRHGGRGITKCLALDQDAGEFYAIQLSLNNQSAATSATSAAGSSWAPIIDFDLSSFIIGEGVVTARFILTVRWRRTASLNLKPCSSSVYSARQAGINIFFTKESEQSGFPYTLKIIAKRLNLVEWKLGCMGLAGSGF